MPDKLPILLLGAGGHCRSCIDVIEQDGRFAVAGIIDQPKALRRDHVLEYPIIGTDDDLPALRNRFQYALVTVGQLGSSAVRVKLFDTLRALGFMTPTIISPRAYVSPHAVVADGTIVMHGAFINVAARVGCNCILNSCCLIEHDAVVGNHCHVSTGAIVNGGSTLGDHSFLGSHSTMIHGITTSPRLFFKAGLLVRSDSDGRMAKPQP